MKSTWAIKKLEEICRIYSGGTPSTSQPEYWNGTLRRMSSGETGNKFLFDTEKKITEIGVKESATKLAKKNSVVIASAGQGYTRGQACFLMVDTYVNQSVIVCEPNEKLVYPLFLYYNLDSRYDEFRLLSDGTSTRGGLSGRIIKNMEIELPPMDEQIKIANILYGFDKKIKNNNDIIRETKSRMHAEFGARFIFFKYEKGFTGSEELPDGWKLVELSEILSVNKRGLAPTYIKEEANGIPVINQRFIRDELIRDEAVQFHDKTINFDEESFYRPYDVLINSMGVGTLGRSAQVGNLYRDYLIHSCVSVLRTNTKYSQFLLGELIYSLRDQIEKMGNGSTGQTSLSNKELGKIKIILPPPAKQKEAELYFKSSLDLVSSKLRENIELAVMRNLLLPKLIKGKI